VILMNKQQLFQNSQEKPVFLPKKRYPKVLLFLLLIVIAVIVVTLKLHYD